jgi:hypothetical protein
MGSWLFSWATNNFRKRSCDAFASLAAAVEFFAGVAAVAVDEEVAVIMAVP